MNDDLNLTLDELIALQRGYNLQAEEQKLPEKLGEIVLYLGKDKRDYTGGREYKLYIPYDCIWIFRTKVVISLTHTALGHLKKTEKLSVSVWWNLDKERLGKDSVLLYFSETIITTTGNDGGFLTITDIHYVPGEWSKGIDAWYAKALEKKRSLEQKSTEKEVEELKAKLQIGRSF